MLKLLSASVAILAITVATPSAAPVTQTVVPHQFGGIFTRNDHVPAHPQPCRYKNPFTSACTCPAGFVAHQIWEWYTNCGSGFYADGRQFQQCRVTMHQCTR